jgi:hypothetical protein
MPKPWHRGTRQRGSVAVTDLTAGPAFVAPCEPVLVRAPPTGPDCCLRSFSDARAAEAAMSRDK